MLSFKSYYLNVLSRFPVLCLFLWQFILYPTIPALHVCSENLTYLCTMYMLTNVFVIQSIRFCNYYVCLLSVDFCTNVLLVFSVHLCFRPYFMFSIIFCCFERSQISSFFLISPCAVVQHYPHNFLIILLSNVLF